jgi:Zn-finger nucleic acid-binding protein
MKCPKCGAEMVTKDRTRIMIEECRGCRGVYLDRGELELLIEAESQDLAAFPEGEYWTEQKAGSAYQGRHRHGVVRRTFGEPDGHGFKTDAGEAVQVGSG